MAETVRDLVKGALRLLGAVDANSPLTANEAEDGRAVLNQMLEAMSTEGLVVYTVKKETFDLVGGTGSYTMGPSGTWNTQRPVRIDSAKYLVGTEEYDLDILTDQEWQAIDDRTLGGFPEAIHNSGASPLAVISVYPVPSASEKLVLYTWQQLTEYASVNDLVQLPAGYRHMLRFNLAVELAPEWGIEPSQIVYQTAQKSKGDIKRINYQPIYLECDDAILGTPRWGSRSDFLGGL